MRLSLDLKMPVLVFKTLPGLERGRAFQTVCIEPYRFRLFPMWVQVLQVLQLPCSSIIFYIMVLFRGLFFDLERFLEVLLYYIEDETYKKLEKCCCEAQKQLVKKM